MILLKVAVTVINVNLLMVKKNFEWTMHKVSLRCQWEIIWIKTKIIFWIKNFEKDGTCKYGAHCTFAHGDKELRNKTENLYQMNNNPMMMPVGGIPVMMPPGMEMGQMPIMMSAPGNFGQNYMMMMPQNLEGMNNNNDNGQNNENKPQQ